MCWGSAFNWGINHRARRESTHESTGSSHYVSSQVIAIPRLAYAEMDGLKCQNMMNINLLIIAIKRVGRPNENTTNTVKP